MSKYNDFSEAKIKITFDGKEIGTVKAMNYTIKKEELENLKIKEKDSDDIKTN